MNKLAILLSVLVMVLGLSVSAQAIDSLTDGLVAYYPFNGNANDESSNGNNGAVYSATLTNDRFGNADSAYSFNGTNAYIAFSNQFLFHQQTDATLSFWINTNYSPAGQSIFWTRNDSTDVNRFNIAATFTYDYRSASNGLHILGGTSITQGEWTHLVISRVGNTSYIFKNGALEYQVTDSSPDLPTVTGWMISGRGGPHMYNGIVDDIRIYNRALSVPEVQQLYTITPTPVGYNPQWLMVTLASLMGAGGYLIRRRTAKQ